MTDLVKKEGVELTVSEDQQQEDRLRISDEVIETIAGIAINEVANITSVTGSIAEGIAGVLGWKNPGKGVRVEATDKDVRLELSLIVDYGCRMHIIARELQKKVREAVENLTGLTVLDVNVNITGINVPKEIRKKTSAIAQGEQPAISTTQQAVLPAPAEQLAGQHAVQAQAQEPINQENSLRS